MSKRSMKVKALAKKMAGSAGNRMGGRSSKPDNSKGDEAASPIAKPKHYRA